MFELDVALDQSENVFIAGDPADSITCAFTIL